MGAGSSPLARGLLSEAVTRFVDDGIIPARAGFTVIVQIFPFILGDHPRSRGVYFITPDGDAYQAGSSPLARGLRYSGSV